MITINTPTHLDCLEAQTRLIKVISDISWRETFEGLFTEAEFNVLTADLRLLGGDAIGERNSP